MKKKTFIQKYSITKHGSHYWEKYDNILLLVRQATHFYFMTYIFPKKDKSVEEKNKISDRIFFYSTFGLNKFLSRKSKVGRRK